MSTATRRASTRLRAEAAQLNQGYRRRIGCTPSLLKTTGGAGGDVPVAAQVRLSIVHANPPPPKKGTRLNRCRVHSCRCLHRRSRPRAMQEEAERPTDSPTAAAGGGRWQRPWRRQRQPQPPGGVGSSRPPVARLHAPPRRTRGGERPWPGGRRPQQPHQARPGGRGAPPPPPVGATLVGGGPRPPPPPAGASAARRPPTRGSVAAATTCALQRTRNKLN